MNIGISFLIVFVSFIIYTLIYVWLSIRVGSWINILTPQFLIAIPTLYLSELYYLSKYEMDSLWAGYFVVYYIYIISISSFSMAYVYSKFSPNIIGGELKIRYNYGIIILFALISLLLYYPILAEFNGSIFDPRAIYIATRTGFGINYFLSMTAAYIFLILVLFHKNINMKLKLMALVIVIVWAYLHGSKGQIISSLFIFMLWFFTVENNKVNLKKFVLISILIFIFGMVAFVSMLNSIDIFEVIPLIAGYSDYSRNAIMLIEDERSTSYGRLLLEENIYSRIPRFIFENKPKDFGVFELAKEYFPTAYNDDQGVPSFGVGIFYADFSFFAIPFLVLANIIGGTLAKIFHDRLKVYRNPLDFIVYVFMCGVTLIPLGAGYLLPEHLMMSILIYFMCRIGKIRVK
jgi:oligosaccharide repeat unit polymerase